VAHLVPGAVTQSRLGSPATWAPAPGSGLNLQTRFDLALFKRDHGARIAAEVRGTA
jgi:hypothetical protein